MHPPNESAIPFGDLLRLRLIIMKAGKVFGNDPIDVQAISADDILHLEHIDDISSDILPAKFLCY